MAIGTSHVVDGAIDGSWPKITVARSGRHVVARSACARARSIKRRLNARHSENSIEARSIALAANVPFKATDIARATPHNADVAKPSDTQSTPRLVPAKAAAMETGIPYSSLRDAAARGE